MSSCVRPKLSPQISMKLEGYNPTGSIKDRACLYMIRGKIEEGTLQPGMTLIDASSGTWLARLPSTESSWDTLLR